MMILLLAAELVFAFCVAVATLEQPSPRTAPASATRRLA